MNMILDYFKKKLPIGFKFVCTPFLAVSYQVTIYTCSGHLYSPSKLSSPLSVISCLLLKDWGLNILHKFM